MTAQTIIALLGFALVSTNVSAQSARVDVTGRIVDASTQDAVAGAAVKLAGTSNPVVTNDDGRFLIRGVTVGRHTLEIEHLGYGKRTHSFDVPAAATLTLEIKLDAKPVHVDGITVTAVTEEDRRARATAGRVVTVPEARIDAAAVRGTRLTDLIRQETGLRVREGRFRIDDGGRFRVVQLCVESRRGSTRLMESRAPRDAVPFCDMLPVFVDGTRIDDTAALLRSMQPSMLARIEYLTSGEASQRYGLAAGDNGAIVLFTKRGR